MNVCTTFPCPESFINTGSQTPFQYTWDQKCCQFYDIQVMSVRVLDSITLLHPSVFVLIVLRFIHSFIEYLQLCKNAGIYNMSLETSFQEYLLILLPIIHSFMFFSTCAKKGISGYIVFFLIRHYFTNC